MSHIAVERNRRRQMNEHLKVLRSLTPCFYIKRGDQASIIGGVIEFIKELHQVVQVLEAKKQRKKKSLSPSPGLGLSLSPKPGLCLSPSPSPSPRPLLNPTTSLDSPIGLGFDLNKSSTGGGKELITSCNSPIADVEAKIAGSNVILKVVSKKIQGQIVKIITILEKLSFEVLHINITSMEDTVLYSFVIKIGLDCQLSVEELAVEVQHSFFSTEPPDFAY